MRSVVSIFILFCIFSVTSTTKAQVFGRNWTKGSYYDTLGNKTTGLIAWQRPEKMSKDSGDYIYYKTEKNSDKIKIPTFRVSSFTMGTDSFTISHHKALYYAPVLKVLVNSPTKLYYWTAEVVNWGTYFGAVGGVINAAVASPKAKSNLTKGFSAAYFYGSNPDTLQLITRKNFIEIMSSILADKPEVVAKIKDKSFDIFLMDDLLTYYHTGEIPYNPNDKKYSEY
ncbi:hypothetical protein [Mucilaginibacter polytrichastri]|uniref:Uncharacterized protein n=1 Tax=Mucilaginibacter polytrichastri TaxID=1302689 RepID=A0A1Q5ZZD1_9SPHI|nr:hypothetical protein [Mucilaginibacter polytrichastri]OKS87111.1 hypothetical protein RG47T_2570 [Mucilaginibacter polytrichastri]SFS87627.1 hypothetical protein SAMN04487890_105180 [Mucilaginibacter polytrichastri]